MNASAAFLFSGFLLIYLYNMDISVDRRRSERFEHFASDQNLAPVFENVFDLYGTLDDEGRIIYLTGSIFHATNTNPDLLKGQQFSETVFWQSSENTPRIIESALDKASGGENERLLIDFRVSADRKIPIELHLQKVEAASGERSIFVCARELPAYTLSAANEIAESEQLLSAAENAEIGLWYWSYRENRILATPRCNDLFELPAHEQTTYEKFRSVIHPDDRDFVDDFLSHSRIEGTKYEEEFRVVYSDGTIEWLCAEGKSFLDDDGNPHRMLGVVRKITEQKHSAQELEKVYDRERKALDTAVEANRAMDFFLAFVSHELRTPLNAILGWSKILLTKEVDGHTLRTALETIERSAKFQTKLINDMVDSSRVASGKIRLEYRPTNLFYIVKNAFEAHKPAADARNIKFEFSASDSAVNVFGDANRLQQVFGNLISNAIKFTDDGGEVLIDLQTNGEAVSVRISDNGRGISATELPNIFRQFYQGDKDQASAHRTLGLGLSIAKILVSKHGGSITAESAGLGQGSRFTVALPISNEEQAAAPEAVRPAYPVRGQLDGLTILIVEDDDDSREVLQLVLEQSGADVTSCNSARAAMHALTGPGGKVPDLMISDIAMPDEDGYSLISTIRKLPAEAGGNIPAIALSAFATEQSRQRALESGFNRYATKPFEPDSLIREARELTDRQ